VATQRIEEEKVMRLNVMSNWNCGMTAIKDRKFWLNWEQTMAWYSLSLLGFTLVWWRRS
jgi:hypothetical protein